MHAPSAVSPGTQCRGITVLFYLRRTSFSDARNSPADMRTK